MLMHYDTSPRLSSPQPLSSPPTPPPPLKHMPFATSSSSPARGERKGHHLMSDVLRVPAPLAVPTPVLPRPRACDLPLPQPLACAAWVSPVRPPPHCQKATCCSARESRHLHRCSLLVLHTSMASCTCLSTLRRLCTRAVVTALRWRGSYGDDAVETRPATRHQPLCASGGHTPPAAGCMVRCRAARVWLSFRLRASVYWCANKGHTQAHGGA